MNQFFYENRGKEKVSHLMKEGLRSQAFERSKPEKSSWTGKLIRLVLTLAGFFALMLLLVH